MLCHPNFPTFQIFVWYFVMTPELLDFLCDDNLQLIFSYFQPVANPIKNLPVKFTRIQLFFYKFSKSNPIKPFLPVNFSGGFYKWIFHWKIHWKKFESYKKICLLVKFTVKKINPIKPRILQGKNLLVNFKIDFHKMKYYNQSYNYIAILIYIKGFNFRNRWNRY